MDERPRSMPNAPLYMISVAAELAGYPAYARVKEQVRASARVEMEQAVARDPTW